jgi:glutamate-1-semialdehyde 2,1-aminomutase
MFGWHFVEAPVTSFETARAADAAFFPRFFQAALRRGVFLPASPFEAGFLSIAHDDAVIDAAAERLGDALQEAAA